jgi:hypothetical protein
MVSIMRLFFRIFIRAFYIINAGYFLFFFILFFGLVSPTDLGFYHLSLILGMFNEPLFMGGVMLLWLFYNGKCILFVNNTINKPENNDLTNLQVFPFRQQFVLFGINQLLLYLPVLIYSGFVIALAFKYQHVGIAFILIAFQIINCVMGAVAGYLNMNSTWKKNDIGFTYLFNRITAISKISYPFYLLTYTAFHRKITFFSIKLFSLFVLYIIFVLNKNDFSFINFIVVFLMLIMAHAMLPFYYINFIERTLSFYRNLPLSLLKISLIYFITYSIILIPELLFLLINGLQYVSLTDIVLLYFVALVNLLLFTAILYTEEIRMKKYLKIIFLVFFVSIFALNLKNYILLIFAELLIATITFISSYHLYESKQR